MTLCLVWGASLATIATVSAAVAMLGGGFSHTVVGADHD